MIEIHKSTKVNEGDFILIQNYSYNRETPFFEVMRVARAETIKKMRIRKKKHNEMKTNIYFNHAKRGLNVYGSRVCSNPPQRSGELVSLTFNFPKKILVRRGGYRFAGCKRATRTYRLALSQKHFLITEDEARLYLL